MSNELYLFEELSNIKQRLDTIEYSLKHLSMFHIPITVPSVPTNVCPKCGLNLEGTLNYSCPNVDCPVGLGPVIC